MSLDLFKRCQSAYACADIEAALQKIDEVKSNQEGIAAEEALILRGYA